MSNSKFSRQLGVITLVCGILIILAILLTGCQADEIKLQNLPSGAEIAFTSWRDQTVDIFRITASGIENLTNSPYYESFPVWSPDGSQIAFLSDQEGMQHLYLMKADGSRQRVLAKEILALDQTPVWAPDGQMIAFACVAEQRSTLCLVSPVGEWIQIMPGEWPSLDNMQWSPTDPVLLFDAISGSGRDIFAYTTYTNQVRNLTNRPGLDYSPAWSPDGRKIAMLSNRNEQPGLYLMNIDGTYPRLLLEGNLKGGLHWSPDGQRIAFSRSAVGGSQLCVWERQHQSLLCSQTNGQSPAWSPDGQYLVFESRRKNHSHLYLSDPEFEQTVRLTNTLGGNFTPNWRPGN
jgi:TolB protein